MIDSQRPPKKPRSNFTQRVISALVLAPPVLGAVWYGGLPFQVLVLVLAGLSAWEYFRLVMPGRHRPGHFAFMPLY
ncbi:MAG: phosphatidate cytidylyltransferase, partial [Niveispirillum sp.]|nr:phosphatidate cytidylyltransferase [Niveispirillum sp.]